MSSVPKVMYECEAGQTFGDWTVIDPLVLKPKSNGYPRRLAMVECSCGHKKLVQITDLFTGASKSCRRHNKVHLGPNYGE